MATLTNTKIKDTYDGLLKTADNDVIGASEKNITDGLGNATVLSIGTGSASFSSDIEVNGLTIGKGNGNQSANTAIGINSLSSTTGNQNTAIGYQTLTNNTTGNRNVAIGTDSMISNTEGIDNVAIGYASSYSNTTGSQNVAFGARSLYNNTTGGSNTALGYNALNANIIGTSNVAVGRSALISNTGSFNTAVGTYSLNNNTTANSNIAIGYRSLYNTTTGGLNIAVGNNALDLNTTGLYNTALGHSALYNNVTGGSNVAVGYHALRENTASNNTSVGHASLTVNTTGTFNSAFGKSALNTNTTGSYNVAIGSNALLSNSTGNYNLAVGSQSLDANTTGVSNTALGHNSLGANTTGINNTAVGVNALELCVDGIFNVALGHGAGSNKTGGSSNTYIGYNAIGGSATSSNEIVIGKSVTGKGDDTAIIGGDDIYLGNGTLGGVIVERAADPFIRLEDTTDSEIFILTNNFLGGQINYNTTTSDHTFRIGASEKMRIGSSTVSVTGNLAVDTNTLYVDAANNRVGVGRSNPASYTSDDGSLYVKGQIRVDGVTNTAAVPSLTLNDTNSGLFAPAANEIAISTAATERMRIDTSGNVGIGGSSKLTGYQGTFRTLYVHTPSGDNAAILELAGNRNASSGNQNAMIQFWNKTSTAAEVGRITSSQGSAVNSGELQFATSSSGTLTERMRIDSSGNVGIGTSSPAAKIHINSGAGNDVALFESTDQAATIKLKDSFQDVHFDQNASNFNIAVDPFNVRGASAFLFSIDGSERMRIDSSGRVGIGTSSPQSYYSGADNLVVSQSSGEAGITIATANNTTGALYFADGTSGSEQYKGGIGYNHSSDDLFIVSGGSTKATIDSSGNVGIGDSSPDVSLDVNGVIKTSLGSGGVSLSGYGSPDFGYIGYNYWNENGTESVGQSVRNSWRMKFGNGADKSFTFDYREANAAAGTFSERMRIDSSGNVLIGKTSNTFANEGIGLAVADQITATRTVGAPMALNKLGANGDILQFYKDTVQVGSVSVTGFATAYNTSSDYRLKENVVPMEGALDRVDALKPSRFNFIADPATTVDGFLAHEVAEVIPEAISGEKDAVDEEGNPIYQGIDQSKIVPLLVGAIQELKAEIELLKSQING